MKVGRVQAEAVRARHEAELLQMDSVEGVSVGGDTENAFLRVRTSSVEASETLPEKLDGVPLITEVSGEFSIGINA